MARMGMGIRGTRPSRGHACCRPAEGPNQLSRHPWLKRPLQPPVTSNLSYPIEIRCSGGVGQRNLGQRNGSWRRWVAAGGVEALGWTGVLVSWAGKPETTKSVPDTHAGQSAPPRRQVTAVVFLSVRRPSQAPAPIPLSQIPLSSEQTGSENVSTTHLGTQHPSAPQRLCARKDRVPLDLPGSPPCLTDGEVTRAETPRRREGQIPRLQLGDEPSAFL